MGNEHDVAMDRAWTAFVVGIEQHVTVGTAEGQDAADLATIWSVVRDLSILELSFLAEFAQIGARLDALKREGLLATASELAGPGALDEVLRCHAEYGVAIGA